VIGAAGFCAMARCRIAEKKAVVLDTMAYPFFCPRCHPRNSRLAKKKKMLANATRALCDSYKGRHKIFHVSVANDHVCVYSTEPVDANTRYAMQLPAGQAVSLLFRVATPKQVM
jgi:hypothetical protein